MSDAHEDQYDAVPGATPATEHAPVEPTEGSGDDYEPQYLGGSRKKKRGYSGCLAVIVALAVILGGAYFVGNKGYHYLKDHLSSAEDYPGPGHGQVVFQVKSGDTVTEIGRELKAKGVVASVQAFMDASDGKTGIQVGYYQLKKKMAAKDAFDVLINPNHILTTKVTVPEGLRVSDTVAILAARTKYSAAQFDAALKDTSALGLPSYANGDPEGYLFPSTYGFGPKEKPADMLKDMVDRWKQAADENDLEAGAAAQGKSPAEIMTIASLIQAEGRGSDMPKVSRVIYNRLDGPGDKGGTNGRLQIDATVNFALDRKGVVAVTQDEIDNTDSPYNTYQVVGLPPGPINSPGDAAMKAALHPADGPWYYYVTVNLRTGETKFGTTYQQFLQYKQEFIQYCQTSDAC
jgi:peptidoglycan lytic transglycosylase G